VKIRVLQTAHGSAATAGGGLPRDVGRRSSKRLRGGWASSGGDGAGDRVCISGGDMWFGCGSSASARAHAILLDRDLLIYDSRN
jgi:hypothetical protein